MKDSIKRAQSRAGSGFAERENFRPKVKQKTKQLMMTLALLLTAASGAWAQDAFDVKEITESMVSGWNGDATILQEGDLPGFVGVDEDVARTWTGASATGKTSLIFTMSESLNYVDGIIDSKSSNISRSVIHTHINNGEKIYYTTKKTEWDLTPDETGKVWTLAKMPAGKVMLLADFYAVTGLAWQLDGQEVTDESDPIIGYVGFELAATFPELYNPNSLTGITYESSNPQVATVDETTGKVTFVAASTTPVTITAHYPGNDTYEGKDVSYRLLVSAPATVTLASNDPALGTVTIYEAIQEDGYKLTADDIGKVLCDDGSVCATVAEAQAQDKQPMGIIVDVDTRHKRATYIALKNEDNHQWGDFLVDVDFNPSADTWKALFKAFGGNGLNYDGLNQAILDAGGQPLTTGEYWLDETEEDEGKANYMILSDTQGGDNVSFNIANKSESKNVRFVYTIPISISNIIPTETAGVYSVLPGTEVVMEANASEDCYVDRWTKGQTPVYSPTISYDNFYDVKTHRMPANSKFILTIEDDANYTAQFAENAYDVTFIAQNKFNIKGGKATVKVGDTDQTSELSHNPDNDSESTLEGVKKGQKVTLSAAQGYKLRKVEAKKVKAMKAVNVYKLGHQLTVIPVYFYPGETWTEALKHPENAECGLSIFGDGDTAHIGITGNEYSVLLELEDENSIPKPARPNDPINPNASYGLLIRN